MNAPLQYFGYWLQVGQAIILHTQSLQRDAVTGTLIGTSIHEVDGEGGDNSDGFGAVT